MEAPKKKINKNKNEENIPHLEITEVVSVQCNIVNNDYQHDSWASYTFVSNKSFGQLLDILPKHFIFLKIFNSKFSYIEAWFTDQNSKPQAIDDEINITLVINQSVKYENDPLFSLTNRWNICKKVSDFCLLLKIERKLLMN